MNTIIRKAEIKRAMQNGPRRLLLVDDSQDILISLKIGLQFRNFIADAFSNPLLALASFEAGKYDLALLDVSMPEMNGFELCRELLKRDPTLKTCFFTAFENHREQFKQEFPEIQSDCFMRKPMTLERLSQEINKFLVDKPIRNSEEQPIKVRETE